MCMLYLVRRHTIWTQHNIAFSSHTANSILFSSKPLVFLFRHINKFRVAVGIVFDGFHTENVGFRELLDALGHFLGISLFQIDYSALGIGLTGFGIIDDQCLGRCAAP